MAETGEIPTWLTGVIGAGTFVGGLIMALFGRGKLPGPESSKKGSEPMDARITALEVLVAQHATLLARGETDRIETRETIGKIFEEIKAQRADLSEIKGMLNGRRESR